MKKSLYLKSFRLRQKLKFIWLCWFHPNILTNERERKALNYELNQHWQEHSLNVYELVHEQWDKDSNIADSHSDRRFIVFIDHELAVDWITKYDLDKETVKLVSTAEAVGARRCKHLPKEQVLEFKRLVGQAVVCAIHGNTAECVSIASEASDFLKARSTERSRYWSLLSAHLIFLVIISLSAFNFEEFLMMLQSYEGIGYGVVGGFLGAYLSIVLTVGKGTWDSAAGFWIHLAEIFSKLLVGLILGGVAVALSHSVHAPPSLTAIVKDFYSVFILGIAAGFSERMIPKIISQYSNNLTK